MKKDTDWFVEELMSEVLRDERLQKYVDYLTENYIAEEAIPSKTAHGPKLVHKADFPRRKHKKLQVRSGKKSKTYV